MSTFSCHHIISDVNLGKGLNALGHLINFHNFLFPKS